MYSNNRYDGIDAVIVLIVRQKTHHLCNSRHFTKDDFQDLEQELIIEVLSKLRNYNPNKASLSTFAYRVVRDKANNLIAHKKCQKNDCNTTLHSPHDHVLNGAEECSPWCDVSDSIELLELKLDISLLTDKLPSDLTQLFHDLQHLSISEISDLRNKSRTTIYEKIKKMRKVISEL